MSASGRAPPFDAMALAAKGSLRITRPPIFTHVADTETCRDGATDLLDRMESGAVRARIDQRLRLSEARRAQDGRATTGSTVLLP